MNSLTKKRDPYVLEARRRFQEASRGDRKEAAPSPPATLPEMNF
jgi:hypothetical protein